MYNMETYENVKIITEEKGEFGVRKDRPQNTAARLGNYEVKKKG